MTQPQIYKWIYLLSEILKRTLKTLGKLPDRIIPNAWYTFSEDVRMYYSMVQKDLFNALWMKTGSLHAIVVKKLIA